MLGFFDFGGENVTTSAGRLLYGKPELGRVVHVAVPVVGRDTKQIIRELKALNAG